MFDWKDIVEGVTKDIDYKPSEYIDDTNEFMDCNVLNYRISTFKQQVKLIEDRSTLIAVQTTRRAAKSYSAGLKMVMTAMLYNKVNILYLALTQDTARNIMLEDIILDIGQRFNVDMTYNISDMAVRIEKTKSTIYLYGADASEKEHEKKLGIKYKFIVIDEAAFFRTNLNDLVYEKLMPTLIDNRGQLMLISTTSNRTRGLFYDVTNGKKLGWSVHKWSTHDNPFVAKAYQETLTKLKNENPNIERTPAFRRMYLNEWVIDDDNRVYHFNVLEDSIDALPVGVYEYFLGVDLGYNDDTAFTVVAYKEDDSHLYVVESWKKSGLALTPVALKIQDYERRYGLSDIIIDGSAKQSVVDMRERFDLDLISADKTDKRGFIEILNSEFDRHKIKIVQPDADPLIDEMDSLIWNERMLAKTGRYIEDDKLPNHCCDSFLYVWKHCKHFYNKDIDKTPRSIEDQMMNYLELKERELEIKILMKQDKYRARHL